MEKQNGFEVTVQDTEGNRWKQQSSKAYIYATCHGIMNLFINGEEITNHQFMPGTQQYDKRLMIETLEVTRFLRGR